MDKRDKPQWALRILETPQEMEDVEGLQRVIWPGCETDVIPVHLLLTTAHNGGLVIGAYLGKSYAEAQPPTDSSRGLPSTMIGFLFGFPGLYTDQAGWHLKHCSHQLGVHPDYRNAGLGFALKRAQWQMVRRQGINLITWTFDPLLSLNAHLNFTRLGVVCHTYLREVYGEMRDELNIGLPSDRFQVDWWLNSHRVKRRLSRRLRKPLDLAHFLSAGAEILNPTFLNPGGLPQASEEVDLGRLQSSPKNLLLVEIPPDYQQLKKADRNLAFEWRLHTRDLFETLFRLGYLVIDFVYLSGSTPRSFYVLASEKSSLSGLIEEDEPS